MNNTIIIQDGIEITDVTVRGSLAALHTTTNSSVQNTSGLVCDWLQMHLPDNDNTWSFIHRWFTDFQELEINRVPGYQASAIVLSSGVVAWNLDNKRDRVFVRLPASALALLDCDIVEFSYFCRQQGATFSRVDFAFDSFGQLDLELMIDKLAAHEVQTRWKKYRVEGGDIEIGSEVGLGKTVYVGSRRSESFLRVYDKTAEQTAKLEGSGVSDEELSSIPAGWVRVELESKKRKADVLMTAVIEAWKVSESASDVIAKHLFSLIDFKDPGDDSNRSRWLTSAWWLEFLEVVSKVGVQLPASEATLEKLFSWVEHIAPALAVAASVDIDWLLKQIAEGQKRFRTKHKKLLDDAGIKFDPGGDPGDGIEF